MAIFFSILLLINIYLIYYECTSVTFDWCALLIYVCSLCSCIYLIVYFV
ncbi:hypothetical protein vBSAP01_04 [Staphylococcus phage vB_SAP01]|nr:hypothetical protein vBSAP01_04 [Staphylococcus phage vB_SAP01]